MGAVLNAIPATNSNNSDISHNLTSPQFLIPNFSFLIVYVFPLTFLMTIPIIAITINIPKTAPPPIRNGLMRAKKEGCPFV